MAARKSIVIIGAGGHGGELLSYARQLADNGGLEILGLCDDGKAPGPWRETAILGTVAGLLARAAEEPGLVINYITALGDAKTRQKVVGRLQAQANLVAWTLVHPTSECGFFNQIGAGTVLAPGSILTTNIRIGVHAIVNTKASVSHDCKLGDFVTVNPGATICGNVEIGEGAYIGAGATIKHQVKIGKWSVVGAGAVVIEDVPEGATVVGVPARVIKASAERASS